METSGARERMENAPAEKSFTSYLEKALQGSAFAKQIELVRLYFLSTWDSCDRDQ